MTIRQRPNAFDRKTVASMDFARAADRWFYLDLLATYSPSRL